MSIKLPEDRCVVVAEMSANHNQDKSRALDIVRAAKDSGADAIKLQTYTADTITVQSRRPEFCIGPGSLWAGRYLYDLYEEAHLPWDWHADLFELAAELDLACFSSPFDPSSVDFLEQFDPPAYKIASPELIDLPLIEYVASKGRSVIMSTGMGTLSEIAEAVAVVKNSGVPLTLLKCTSAYPASPETMNLNTIPHLADTFGVVAGLSDHTHGIAVPVAAVALGAKFVEKHFTLSRDDPGPDSAFSLEPAEFRQMVDAIRVAERATGAVCYEPTPGETANRVFRRSLYAVTDIERGEAFTEKNVRSVRPGLGLAPKHYDIVLGKKANRDLALGTPLSWDVIE